METLSSSFEPIYILTFIGILILVVAFALYRTNSKRPDDKFGARAEVEPTTKPAGMDKVLSPTREAFWGKLKNLFSGDGRTPQIDEIEEILYTSDLGPKTVQRLLASVEERLSRKELQSFEALRGALVEEMSSIVQPVHQAFEGKVLLDFDKAKPLIWLVVGVNGAGKTTTIGKLAGLANSQGKKVLVAAGDTFRAAASSQLAVWSKRAQVEIFESAGKPSGVAFDAVQKAQKDNFDLVIIDTAGRLHTQANLMEELKKVKRVIEKALPGAPHETLLVLDANNGQNALVQARQFHEALQVTGVILTKLDGTAKGGVVVGLAHELGLPVRALGVGEKMEDLRPFSVKDFVASII